MSLPWNKSVCLRVGSNRVDGTLSPAWTSARTLARSSCPIEGSPTAASAGDAVGKHNSGRSAAIEAVLSELISAAKTRASDLKVLMADASVHFDVVAGDYREASNRHLQSIALACMSEMLGERSSSQVVRWQLQPDMRHLLISAMDQGEIEAMLQVAANHRMALRSLQPSFCDQWNRHATKILNGTGLFASVDETHTMVACVERGAITALSFGPTQDKERPLPGNTKGALDQRTDRLLASMGQDVSAVSTFVLVASGSADVAAAARWDVIRPVEEQP